MDQPILSLDGLLPSVLNLARRHAWQKKLPPATFEQVASKALGRALLEPSLTARSPIAWVIRSVRVALEGR
jgi:hypothetical protein